MEDIFFCSFFGRVNRRLELLLMKAIWSGRLRGEGMESLVMESVFRLKKKAVLLILVEEVWMSILKKCIYLV